jgi:hypothetical protein
LEGQDVNLTIASVLTVSGNIFFEQTRTLDGDQVIRVSASQLNATLGAGGVALNLRNGSGAFLLRTAGMAGRASGQVSLTGVPGLTLSAHLTLEFNQTPVAVDETIGAETLQLSAGSFTRVSGQARLGLSGFVDVNGLFAFESGTGDGGGNVIKAGATAVQATMGLPGAFGVRLSDGELAMMLYANGTYALDAVGTVALEGVAGIGVSGDIQLQVNNTNAQVHESLVVEGRTLSINFGAAETNIMRFTGNNLLLTTPVGNVSGNFLFEKDGVTNEILVAASDIALFVGDDRGTASTSDDIGV